MGACRKHRGSFIHADGGVVGASWRCPCRSDNGTFADGPTCYSEIVGGGGICIFPSLFSVMA